MKRTLQLALGIALIAAALPALGAEVVDRILATVNRAVVLQSDLDVAMRYQALVELRPLDTLTQADAQVALGRLIDQQLLLEDMGNASSFAVSEDDVRARVREVRGQFPQAATEQGWNLLLQRYGLHEADIVETVKVQLQILRFVDQRLRPNVRVDDAAVEAYYRDDFLPKIRQAGGKEVPLAEVSARIRQILVERHIDELLGTWLHNLRNQSEIHTETAQHVPAQSRPADEAQAAVDIP